MLTNSDVSLKVTGENPLFGRVVFSDGTTLKAMNADGSGVVTLFSNKTSFPAIDPGNTLKIAFSQLTGQGSATREIFTANFDANGGTQLTNNGVDETRTQSGCRQARSRS